ncbi:MAG: Ig domain-containing protein [Bacteroidales bacterium]|nr:Ig domain-containing protein [Bacteroidales bacterium]
MKTLKILALIAIASIVYSCGGGGGDKPNGPITPSVVSVTSVTLSKTAEELVIGNTLQLSATVSPSNATDKTVTWSSSNSTVASVSPTGLVTAKAEGSANIIASCGGKSATCKITVKKPAVAVSSVELDKSEITLDAEETYTLKATVKPDNATDKSVTWASSKTDVATVDNNGKVTGVNNGVASITASSGGKTASCKVTVVVKVKSISLSQTSASLKVGEAVTLSAKVKPDNATDKTVTWSTSDASIATVSNGVVTAKKIGTATITAKADDKSATCAITVVATGGHEGITEEDL